MTRGRRGRRRITMRVVVVEADTNMALIMVCYIFCESL
jgi:hypothetical protein